MAATTAVTFTAPGSVSASPTVASMALPLVVGDASGVVSRDVENAATSMTMVLAADVRAVAMTSDRSVYVADATSVSRILPDGRLDESFAEVGRVSGLSNIVDMTTNEADDRVYVLDGGDSSSTLIAMTLDGEVLATVDAGSATRLAAGASVVVAFGATLADATVWSRDLSTSTPLNLDVDVDPAVQVSRVTAVPPARSDEPADSVSVVIADAASATVRRFALVNPTAVVPTLTLVGGSDAIAMQGVTALAAMADGSVFVARSIAATNDVVKVSADDDVQDESTMALVRPATALTIAAEESDAADTTVEEPRMSSRSLSVSNAPCVPTTQTTGRYTLHKFVNTSEACDYTTLPDSVTAIDVLVVGGGGGAGAGQSTGTSTGGGGGGAAQLVSNIAATPSSTWPVQVGAGGAGGGGSCCGGNQQSGSPGGSSTFGDIVVAGGQGSLRQGLGGTAGAGGTANVGGVAGGNGGTPGSGAGGAGTYFTITGTSVCFGAGGGGGSNTNPGVGGAGGCGVAASTNQEYRGAAGGNALTDGINAQSGSNTAHFGGDIYRGHGGGGAALTSSGGTGGPGVVYVRFATVPTVIGPTSTTVEATKNATLSVTATAGTATTNQLAYQWRKDGVNIAGATSSTLTVAAADMDDAGQYDVVVTNDDGSGKTSSATSSAATLTVEPRSFNFKISSLTVSTTNRTAMEVASYTGDDRGGMAISSSRAFLLGDSNLASFDKNVTSGTLGTTTTRPYFTQADSIVSDVKAQKAYVFDRGNTSGCGVVASPCFTKLIELNASTGATTATEIVLSQPIPQGTSGSYHAGYGRVVYRNGSTGVVYDIDLPSGDVTVVGTVSMSPRVTENNGQSWGVAEYFDGDLWLAYAVAGSIQRTNVRTGTTQTIVLCNCSDLASFVVDPSMNRWYFHWEGYATDFAFGVDETFGYASAAFETLPSVTITPSSSFVTGTSTTFAVRFQEGVTGIAADDFSLSGTSTGWSITSVSAQSSSQYTVTVNQTSGTEGTLALSMRSGAGSWTGGGGAAIPSVTVSSSTVTVDQTAPTASFTTVPAGPLSSASSTFTVTFSEAISGLTAGDFSNAGTAPNCTIAPASSSGTAISVAVSGCGDGTLELRLAAGAVTDAAGNTGPASAVTAASRAVDGVPGAPTLSFSHSIGSLTNASTLTYTLTANEPISGLSASDITNVGTAQNCQIAVSGTQPGTTFTVTVTGCDDGTVILRLTSGSVSDSAGNVGPGGGGGTVNTVVTTLAAMGPTIYSASHPNGTRVYVPDGSSTVRVIDTSTNTQTTTIAVGSTPYAAAVTPDGAFLYVANYSSGTVSKIATSTNTVVATITVGSLPIGAVVTPDGTRVLVTNHSSSTMSSINVSTNAVTTISLGYAPWNLRVTPDGRFAYVGMVNNTMVAVVNLTTNTVSSYIAVGSSPFELVLNNAATRLYVANYGANTVSVINTSTNTVIGTISGFSNPMGLAITSDDQTVYVAEYSAARVRWFDTSTNTIQAGSMSVGSSPRGVSLSPDGTRGYVSNTGSQSFTIFNAAGQVQSTSVSIDQGGPSASFTTVPAGPLSSASSTYTVTFSEAVSGLAAGDFSNVGTAPNCTIAPASSSGTVINVTVSGCGDGSLELELAADSVTDAAGNTGPAAAVTAVSRYVDGTPGIPRLSFSAQSSRTSNATTLTYTLTANEPISGLSASDITNVGTAQNCQIDVSGTQPGTSFTVTVTNCSDGNVVLRLARDSVVDRAGLAGPNSTVSTQHASAASFSGQGNTFFSAPSPDGTKVYFTVTNTNRVRIYDVATRTLSATQYVTGNGPRGIAVSPDGQRLYVSNYSANTVSVLNAATGATIATINVGVSPNGMALSVDGSRLLVANLSGNSVSVISTSTNTVTNTISLTQSPWTIRLTSDGRFAYVGNYNTTTVSVVNMATMTRVSDITVQSNPYELELNRDDSRLYVANYGSASVSVIDTSSHTVIRTVSGVFNGPMGVTVSPDNQTVYVANYGSNTVRWFDATTYAAAAGSIAISGSLARAMTMSPDGSFNFVTTEGGGFNAFHTDGNVASSLHVLDRTASTASFTTVPTGPLSSASSTFVATFSEFVTGISAGDFTNVGTAQNCVIAPASSSGVAVNVAVSGCGEGTLVLELAADAVTDAAGNTGPASAVTAASRFVDGVPGVPVLAFSHANGTITNASTLTYTLTANEPVTGLTASDITNIGTAQDCQIAVTGTQPGTTFTVTVTSCGAGTVQLRLATGAVSDAAGNTAPGGSGETNTLDRTITGMGSPMYSALHPDGSRIYVTDSSSLVRVISLSTYATLANISVGGTPRGVVVTPDGSFVYVANNGSNTVSKISTATNTVVATISVGGSPNGLAITPGGDKVIVANYGGNSLSVITTSNDAVSTIALGRAPWSVKVAPDGGTAYTANVNNATVSVVNLSTNAVTTHIAVGSSPHEVGINRAGTRVYAGNYSSGSVSVIDTATNAVIHTVAGITGAMGIGTSIDDGTVYVVSYSSQRIRWFDASTFVLSSSFITAGSAAWGLTMSPDGAKGYVANYSGGSLTIFHAAGSVQSTSVTVDQAAPTVSFTSVPAGPLTPSAATFTLTFSEAVSGLVAGDFSNVGTAPNCTFVPASTSGTTINVTVSGCGDGTLELQLAADAVVDAAGNTGPATAVTAASRYVDQFPGAPILSFTQNPASPNNAATLVFTLTSNERISGLEGSDISNIGTATGCTVAVSGTQPGTTFQVSVTDCSPGTVQLRVANGSVTDGAGTAGPSSGGSANSLITNVTGLSNTMYSAVHPDGTKVYVASQGTNRVSVMNSTTNTVTTTVAVGSAPRGIDVTPSGEFVYVANYSSDTVSKISTATNTVVRTISVGANPLGLAISADGSKVVVSNYSSSSLSIINTATDTVSSTINMGRRGWNLKLSPDGRTAYVGNVSNASVAVVNLTTNTVTTYIAVGSNPYEVGINRSGTRVYAANYSSHTVSVIDTATNTVIRTVTGLSSPMGIMTSMDDRTVYVVNYGSQRVRWFDADTYALNAGQIVVASAAWGLAMSPDGSRGYVSNYSSQTLTVFAAEGFVQSAQVLTDQVAPAVVSFVSNTNSPNDLSDQSWTLRFSEPVSGLEAADFAVAGTSTGWTAPVVTGAGDTWTVSVSHASPPEGTVTIALREDAITDVAGNTGPGEAVAGETITWRVGQGVFKIESLTTNNVTAKEVASQTGDDRGGIALTTDRALLTGDAGMGRFDLNDLNNGVRAVAQNSTWMDAIVTDIKTLKTYAFNLNSARNGSLTTLTQVDASTGLLTSTVVTLSSAIPVASGSAIFAGYSRVAIWTGGILYDISLPSGQVTNYGAFSMPARQGSENWATWGVVEYFGGQLHLVYNTNSTTISRVNVATGVVSTVFANANGFSDMASFVVNPRANRWYFHYEGRAGAFSFGSDETLGFADATFNVGGVPPEAVTNLTGSTRSSTAVLTWDAPTDGPTPTDYVIQYSLDGGATWRWVNDGVSTSTTASIPGFTPGATVRFRVASVSGVNSSSFVATEDSMVSPFATAPTITAVTTADRSLNVAFTAPSSPGASAITTYQYSLDGGTTWTTRSSGTTGSPLTITGLTNGTEYPVSLRAMNTQGAGEASASVMGTPTTTPDAPVIGDVTPTASGTLTVAFTAPANDGGTTITNYQYSINNGSTWVTRSPMSVTSPIVIGGLSNGSSYNIRLRAVNARGTGAWSTAVLGTAGVVSTAPTISSVSSGDGTINMVFSPPSYNGGLNISNYEYSTDGGATWIARNPVSVASPLQIDGLTNGTSYTVSLRAVNAAGVGAASASRIAAPSRTPDAPTIASIEPSSQRLRVLVTAPAFDGGISITNYQYSTNDGATWVTLSPVNTTGTFSITGLNNAQEYRVRVRAVNARGSGAASAAVAATPATTPGAPVITGIAASNQTLNVAFTAGATGGAAPTNYEYSLDDGNTWTAMSPSRTTSPLTITGLTNGTSYPVRIRAVNAQGAGASSGATDGVPATTASAPTIDAIVGSDSRISVSVTNGFNGGATITNYEYSTDGGTTWTTRMPASAQSPVVIGGLVNATDYSVSIRAVNSQGSGAASASVIGRPVTVPNAPVISNIAGSPGTLTVTFTAPTFNGGATITNYEYSIDGGTTWTTRSPGATTSPLTVTGLIDGLTYPVSIRAVNSQGGGVASAMVEGIPENAPGAPVITATVSGNQSLRVTFTPASPRGLTVTNYQYSLDDGASWIARSPDSTASPLTIEGLTNGTTYPIKIRGVNARGAGLPSDAVDGIPSTPPGAPTITSVTAGAASGSLVVAFSSGMTGGAAITATEYSLDGGTSWTNGDQAMSPVTITGLTNGATYGVKLRHVNLRGAGVASTSVSGVPLSTPGAPTLVSVRGGDGTITAYAVPPAVTGGTPVTNYEYFVEYGNDGAWVAVSPASTSMPIVITSFARFDNSDPDDPNPPLITTSLVNGNNYQVKVRAVNARGVGDESQVLSVKPSTTPGAATISSITAQDSQLTVAFSAPVSDGGEAIRNYEYSLDGGTTWTARAPVSADSPMTITGLTNGTDYDVAIRAVNVQGSGAASNVVQARPAGSPGAPTVAAVTSGDGALSVYFAQGSDNGAATTNVEYSIDGSTWVARSAASTASPLTITGLTNGTAYPVRIRMVNVQGSGTASSTTTATPARAPDAPTIDAITPADGALVVTVTAGANGGAPVTTWQYSTDNGAMWTSTASTSTSFTVPSLENGTSYAMKVRAVNRMGAGASTATTDATPSTTPDAPTILGVTSGDGRVSVTFTQGFNGGDATSNVAYSLDGGSTWSLRSPAGTGSPIVVAGLTNGTSYNLRVAMVNGNGRGAASSAQLVRAATTPAAPSISSIASDNRALTVSVTAPGDDGGDDIINYEYSLDAGASWMTENSVVGTGSFAITGLTNGTSYAVIVRAVNGFGAGASSGAVQGTPSTVPTMPVIVSTTPGDKEIDLAFLLGPNGGSTITNIQYSIDDGANWTTRSPASVSSPLTITGLQNGVTYPIRVRAVNAKGSGVASRTSGTPATTPGAPLVNRVAPLDGGLRVEFEPPVDNGGAFITNYAYRVNAGAWTALSPSLTTSPFDITGLTNGTSYSVEVAAINSQTVLSGAGANAVASSAVAQSPARRPSAPTIVGSTTSDGSIDIGFTVPDDGGRSVSAIDYSLDDGDSWTTVLAAQSPIVVQGLVNGASYQVRLRARNELGLGAVSVATSLVPSRAPFAPTVQSIVRGDTTLSVAFRLGADGGDAITDVEYSLDGGLNWLQRPSPSIASPLNIGSLTNGTEYAVKLRAVNVQGSGDASLSSTGMPVGVPSAPTIASVTRGDRAATVAFTLGAANGGTVMNVEYSLDGGSTWTARNPVATTSPFTISGLTNGSAYQVRVRAVNEMGAGAASNATSVTPATTPDAPIITSVIGEDTQLKVSFTPGGNGGDALTNLAYSIDDGVTWTTRSPASLAGPLTVTGLLNGTTYAVRLKMINSVGEGAVSAAMSGMPSGPPSAPTITSVTGSDGMLSIAFTAGATGGAAITAYDVSTDGGSTWTRQQVTASPLTVGDLVNGSVYSVRLRAVNSRGTGTASSTAQGTPATNPSAPQITEVISDDGAVHVNFMFGDTGGSPVTNVEYSTDGGSTWTTRTPASVQRPLTIAGLSNGTTYGVRVRAVNAIGESDGSPTVNALPATAPDTPTIDMVRSGNGALNVEFTAPSSNGGAAITHYQYSLDGGASWLDSPSSASPIEITGVTVGTDYTVDLRAVNMRGAGPSATAATAKRVTAPPAPPVITQMETGDGFVSLRYVPPTNTGGTELDRYYFSLDGGENWTQITGSVQSNSMSFASSMTLGAMNVYALSGPTTQTLTITGLDNGTNYNVAVRGAHVEALGLPSVTRSAIPSTTPAAVRSLTVGSDDQRLEVSFAAPSDNGGSTVMGYQYSFDGGSTWFDVAQIPFVVDGLDNGVEYELSVRAVNGNGGGTVSTVDAVPSTTAGAPQNLVAVAGERSAALSWEAPTNNGGTPVTDYLIQYSTNNGISWVDVPDESSTARTAVISPLTAGVSYVFRLIPVNAAGRGAPSAPSSAVTPTAPPVPVPDAETPPVPAPINQPATRPVARPVTRPEVSPPTIELLPGSGGVPVAPGEAGAIVDGVFVEVNLSVNEDGTGVVERPGEFLIRILPRDASGAIVQPDEGTALRALRGRTIELAGDGFAPSTVVEVWLNSDPVRLGEVMTDGNGSFTAVFEIPAGVEVGAHTLTLSGLSKSGATVTSSLGLVVVDDVDAISPGTGEPGGSANRDSGSDGLGAAGWAGVLMAILLVAALAAWLLRGRRRVG